MEDLCVYSFKYNFSQKYGKTFIQDLKYLNKL